MEVLYTLEEKEILKEKPLNDGFKLILARWTRKELGNKTQYITWVLNPESKLLYTGNYFDTLEEASENYLKRIS